MPESRDGVHLSVFGTNTCLGMLLSHAHKLTEVSLWVVREVGPPVVAAAWAAKASAEDPWPPNNSPNMCQTCSAI